MRPPRLELIGISGVKRIENGDDLSKLIYDAARDQGTPLTDGDIVVVTHVAVAKAEGRTAKLSEVKCSPLAEILAEEVGKEPAHVEVILRDTKRIIRLHGHHLITQTKSGIVCANSGVDVSNVAGGDVAGLLPKDPDASASRLRRRFKRLGVNVAVIISDTHGRALRRGQINVAIGAAGITPIVDLRGRRDLYGYTLRIKQIAVADEIAGAAELMTGSAAEGIPAVIVRGYGYKGSSIGARVLNRPMKSDLFI